MSGVFQVKAQCLPFREIPHTTRLFTDFLSWAPSIQSFYPRPPQIAEWIKDEAQRVSNDNSRRERVATVLERQNKNWGASPETQQNLARFRRGAAAVVTGQQVGLFGGPAFAIFKALTAIKLARQATAAGTDCVPVFWLATIDHDLDEVNQVKVPDNEGVLRTFISPTLGVPDAPVGRITLGPEAAEVVESAAELLGETEASSYLRESYRSGENLGSAFARLFARLFADWGVILLDASDPELHAIATPISRAAVDQVGVLNDGLLARGKELEQRGYHQQVKVTPSSTLLFALQKGARVPVHRDSTGDGFVVAQEKLSRSVLLQRIESSPGDFSPNVLLRPIIQDYLLPTAAYVGGSAEIAYFAQADVIYRLLLGRTTPAVPRFSATLVEPRAQSLLERYGLGLKDLFHGPELLREELARRTLPQDLKTAFDRAEAALNDSVKSISREISRLDKTLVESAANAGSKIRHQLEQLRARAARAELRQSEVLARHANLLSNTLYPEKTLQEREVAGIYFVSRYGRQFLPELYDCIHTDCFDHQVTLTS
jgi:bacillithiol biosynthesis cysteine-adding enzyme BshC